MLTLCKDLTIPIAYEELYPKQRIQLEQIVDKHNSDVISLRDVSNYLKISKVTLQVRLSMCKTLWDSLIIDSDRRCHYYDTEDFLILVFWCLNKHHENCKTCKTVWNTISPRRYQSAS